MEQQQQQREQGEGEQQQYEAQQQQQQQQQTAPAAAVSNVFEHILLKDVPKAICSLVAVAVVAVVAVVARCSHRCGVCPYSLCVRVCVCTLACVRVCVCHSLDSVLAASRSHSRRTTLSLYTKK